MIQGGFGSQLLGLRRALLVETAELWGGAVTALTLWERPERWVNESEA